MKQINKDNVLYIPAGTYYRDASGNYTQKNSVTVVYKERNIGLTQVTDTWIKYIKDCIIRGKPFNARAFNCDYIPFKRNVVMSVLSPWLKYPKPSFTPLALNHSE